MPLGEEVAAAAAKAGLSRGGTWAVKQFGRTQLERLLHGLYKRHGRAADLYRDSFYAWAADPELRQFLEGILSGRPPQRQDRHAFEVSLTRHLLRTPPAQAEFLAAEIAQSAIDLAPETVRSVAEAAKLLASPELLEEPWLNPRLRPLERIERARALQTSGWQATFESIYPSWPLVTLAGTRFPITTLPAARDDWFCIEAARGALDTRATSDQIYEEAWDPAGQEVFDWHHDLDRWHSANDDPTGLAGWIQRHHDGPAFIFRALPTPAAGRQVVNSSLGWYYQSLATSESLSDEFLGRQLADPLKPLALTDLPRRNWLHERVTDPVTDGSRRQAALSIATVVLWNSPDGWKILMSPRSRSVASDAFFDHVAPSGIFAPLNWQGAVSMYAEYSVRLNIYREYAEELFDREDLERGLGLYNDVRAYPEIGRLEEMLSDDSSAQLAYTGISVNLLTLRPEICALLLIRDPHWLAREAGAERQPRLGWEYLPNNDKVSLGRPLTRWLDLDANLEVAQPEVIQSSSVVPNAAAAVALSLPVAQALVL
jgi:hypothetical protein